MQSPPLDLTPEAVLAVVRDGWLPDARSAEYLPVGFGSHHWRVKDGSGTPWFVSADDVAAAGAQERLAGAFGAAVAAVALGVPGVHAPVPSRDGDVVVRTGRWGVSVQPWLDGSAGRFGDRWSDDDAVALVRRLAALHAVDAQGVPLEDNEIPGRLDLEAVLAGVRAGRPPEGGPPADRVGGLLAGSLARLRTALEDADGRPAPDASRLVVTHGEPHPGNVVRTADGPVLVDWDTARRAEPERDLWLVAARTDVDVAALYEQLTGRRVDRERFADRARHWLLLDVVSFVPDLLAAEEDSADTAWQLAALGETLEAL
ncbi:aminoglycoside phosphotransferase family protein [Phycicoccus avicenniae]|uniref:aminoglycoside phosphotransferase family protein n=1 Tax=Phycicoccus avicenniae TaxID=2828860 RepID=UPI003D2D7479